MGFTTNYKTNPTIDFAAADDNRCGHLLLRLRLMQTLFSKRVEIWVLSKAIVRDDGGSPIAEASVAIFRLGTSKLLKQVSSARDGSFLAKIIPGSYTVLAVAQGFNPTIFIWCRRGRASEVIHGFQLERSGSGNTLPEKRLDQNSSKWRIRAAQSQRSIYQNREGESAGHRRQCDNRRRWMPSMTASRTERPDGR